MYTFDAVSSKNETLNVKIEEPAWECTITEDGEKDKKVYCYFPSELYYRQGYLNTHAESYLCYFEPPDAFTDPSVDRTFTVTKQKWDSLNKEVFNPSTVIMAHKWRHSGVQHSANREAFDPKNYILISKPSAAWYIPSSGKNSLTFDYIKNAAEQTGSLVPFVIQLKPVRFVLNNDYAKWLKNNNTFLIPAVQWDDAFSFSGTFNIYSLINIDGATKQQFWTGSYPIMHNLILNDNNWNENFITDEIFSYSIQNFNNHATAMYNISLTLPASEIGDLWTNVHIKIC